MKTITQFAALVLKNAETKIAELTQSGKTAEELPAALTEALKVEGDKLKMLMHAVEIGKLHPKGLKRVIVLSLAETEKAPPRTEKRDDHYYLVEFFPQAPQAEAPRRDVKDGRGGGRGGKKGDRPRGGGGGRENSGRRSPDGPRPAVQAAQGGAKIVINPPTKTTSPLEQAPGHVTVKERPKRPRRERKPLPPITPDPIGFVVKPKSQQTEAPATTPVAQSAQDETKSKDSSQ